MRYVYGLFLVVLVLEILKASQITGKVACTFYPFPRHSE